MVERDDQESAIERGHPERGLPGAVRTKQMVRPLGRHILIDEVHAIVDRVHALHGSDHAVAVAVAHKIGTAVDRLAEAMHEHTAASDD